MDLRRALGLEEGHVGQEENTCSYEIFPTGSPDLSASDLEALRAQLLAHLLEFVRDYIWQRDRFTLHASNERAAPWQLSRRPRRRTADSPDQQQQQQHATPHLWGCTNFGDNIEDEWFIVWLLLELTRAFPVTARVWDNDGEFLLIEAAYGLPRWLKPETAQNRVWLHGGTVHLVPPPRFAGDPLLGATPSLAQALAAIRGSEIDTLAPAKMQAALQPRVSGYPAQAAEQLHVAHAVVPARVAHVLRCEPQLLAAAVEAFHYRDPDDVKAAARMATFPPTDMVLAAPRFSRCLYAQLALQEYAPPRGYPMPMPSDPQYKAADVGLKLTAGFEMVCANRARFGRLDSEAHPSSASVAAAAAGDGSATAAGDGTPPAGAAAAAVEASLAGDPAWGAFCSRLEASGYFRGTLPGSAQHSQLLAAAEESYQQTAAYRRSTALLAAPALRVDALLSQPVDPATFPPAAELPPEGSEAWLQAGAEAALEGELARRQAEQAQEAQRKAQRRGSEPQQQQGQQAGAAAQAAADVPGEEDFDPGELAGKLRSFMDMMAGVEGAELPGDEGARTAGGGTAGAVGVDLDEARFAAELQRVLGLSKGVLRGLEGRAAGEGGDEDDGSESSNEGSSFFSDGDGSSQSDVSDDEAQQQQQQQQQRSARQQQVQPAAPAAAAAATAAPVAGVQPQEAEEDEEDEERRRQEGWEADTATDSDDDARFMEAYGQAMDAQLASTRMVESFERVPGSAGAPIAAAAGGGGGAAPAPAVPAGQGEAAPGDEAEAAAEAAALRPVDIDFNLVNSLLASYGEQQGMPGPAGSLASLLGLKLPEQGKS